MDSDSSVEGSEEHNSGANSEGRSWDNKQQQSDVSDDENFSRGAKSIESPPESPPRGGGNLDSPPASPAQAEGAASPGQQSSIESQQSISGGSSPYQGSPRPPESPMSNYEANHNKSPDSLPDDSPFTIYERMRRRSLANYPRSPDKSSKSSSPNRSYSKSPSPPRRKSPAGPKSPDAPPNDDSNSSDDGRSNISSNSSIGSSDSRRSSKGGPEKKADKVEIKSHGEDLSDVSDIESLGSISDNETSQPKKEVSKKEESHKTDKEKKIGLNMTEDTEQLDFEAEEDREEGECEVAKVAAAAKEVAIKEGGEGGTGGNGNAGDTEGGVGDGVVAANGTALSKKSTGGGGSSDEEGEVKELEEGELSDEGDNRPEETEPRPVCRFFSRGQCTWGSSCSFRHVAADNTTVPLSHPPPQQICPPGGGFPRGFLARFIRPWIRRGGFLRFPFLPRFVHPGVTDKGNYTMFDMVRPLVPMNNAPPPHVYGGPIGPVDFHRPIDRVMPPPYQQPPFRKEEPAGESAWERGLRQAKELLRKSSKRKESEVDFEDKKLNLSITQDEFDKENDYYNRSGSPYPDDHYDRYSYKSDGKRYRSVSDRFADYGPPAAVPSYYGPSREAWHYDDRAAHYPRHHQADYHHPRGGSTSIVPPDDYYDRKRHKYPSREVIVQRVDKPWKEESPVRRGSGRSHAERGSGGGGGARGDEWSDPWMRSKSPSRKVSSRPRKKSYSSQSSYSSSSSSRSSSYSSYSRSRSGSRSSRTSRSRSRSMARKKVASPLTRRSNRSPFSRAKVSPAYISEKRAETERSLHMNPPPPSPRAHASSPSLRRNPTPPTASERAKGLSARLLAAAMRDRSASKSSRSSSGSDSSGSSSDSSSDSVSSSSSSRLASSPIRPTPRLAASSSRNKRIVLDEKLAQAMKVKAMDALKLSGQKQQIKLTLKSASERLQPTPLAGRKRPAESPPFDGDDSSSVISSKAAKKPAPSRREELLKQLKAVEDAIARKRSKV